MAIGAVADQGQARHPDRGDEDGPQRPRPDQQQRSADDCGRHPHRPQRTRDLVCGHRDLDLARHQHSRGDARVDGSDLTSHPRIVRTRAPSRPLPNG